jgi:hypothetical protein
MANKKISQLTPKGSALAGTDLVEVSVFNGVTYDTKSLTGANVVSGLQPTLVSATNIKTINSTTLLGSGDIAISTGLTVGTTPITSGTVGRVLFEGTGNVVQQDSTLFWDNTNKRLGVGATPSASVRLDVRAQGALSTDIAFRVRNSADTTNIFQVNGDAGIVCNGRIGLNMAANASADLIMTAGSGSSYGIFAIGTYGTAAISARPDTTTTQYNFYAPACANFGAYRAENSGGGTTVTAARIGFSAGSFNANAFDNIGFKCDIANSGGGGSIALDIVNGNFRFGTGTGTKIGTATTEKIAFWNATPIVQPTTAVAAAAFVSNSGTTVHETSTFDGYTLQQIVKALRNAGLLA